jgi:hypothetical protein
MKTVHAVKKMLALETEDPAEKALHRKSLHRIKCSANATLLVEMTLFSQLL